ncbi:unnamed protein product [Nezara viridula]|uniref:RING-type E3 ubiquitin transferase n=1 Tax=Nezara viridula TaxID=85310 RepID=A0A9P0HE52_NEZVI|nr:unnamed protein product [Nezara viridula]
MSLITTNWPSEFSELKKLEGILHCPICYEYINTCMITSCSHNFCSVCIRKYLQFKNQCPTCSEETYAGDLRKNRPLDEIVTIYTDVKERLLFKLRLINVTQSIKGCQTENCNGFASTPKKSESDTSSDKDTPKSEKPKKKVVQKLFSEKKPPEPLVVGGLTIPTIFQPRKSPKKNVALPKPETKPCPVCNVDVPVKNINFHLDSCLAAADPVVTKPKPPVEKRKPLTKLVYTMMKEKELKRYLKEHGLNSNGDRKSLIWRLNRYTVLYNAECDSEHPRPVADILKQVEREEREEKTTPLFQAPKNKTTIDKNSDPEIIEKHNKEYLQVNKDHFNALIESMKKRMGKNIKTSNRIDSDEEIKPDITPLVEDQVPSTSKATDIDCTVSIYSQVTVVDSDSDSDIFEKSTTKIEADVHQIDWNKTKVNEEFTQETDLKDETVKESKELDDSIIHDEDSNSYESVFDKSGRGEISLVKTPVGKAHSLSARKKTRTPSQTANSSPSNSKMEKMVDEIFEKNDDKMSDQLDEESESDEDDDESEDEGFQFKTPVKNYDMSPEISPMKTRSKRKCAPSTDEKKLTRSETRQKRVKRSISPCY